MVILDLDSSISSISIPLACFTLVIIYYLHYVTTVSYTHLDVYKRQFLHKVSSLLKYRKHFLRQFSLYDTSYGTDKK